jgi:hypothetical protein
MTRRLSIWSMIAVLAVDAAILLGLEAVLPKV